MSLYNLGSTVIQLRERSKCGRVLLARFLNISPQELERKELGKRPFTISELEYIADLYGLTLQELVEGKIDNAYSTSFFGFDENDLLSIAVIGRVTTNLREMVNLLE